MTQNREKRKSKRQYLHHYVILKRDAPQKIWNVIRLADGENPYVVAETETHVELKIRELLPMSCHKKHIKERVRRKGHYESMKLNVWTPEANTRLMRRFHSHDFKGMTRAERTQITKWIIRRHRRGAQGQTMLGEYREHLPWIDSDYYCLAGIQTKDGLKNNANTVEHLAEVTGRPVQQVATWLLEIKTQLADQGLGILTASDVTPKMLRDYAYPLSANLRRIIGKLPDGPKPQR